jgi:hypothetical protein
VGDLVVVPEQAMAAWVSADKDVDGRGGVDAPSLVA